ncbi:hypothetical protein SPBR_05438 [Sporothrix brasiliensis 5110]|uniref:Uncharacterized protein n=1 Tax=Sporothrix brasiliensis 5110 TaxID=1398154 RepID=A0A0C2F915_9PEZI|nr:uncharacterized protein SPBR_05438 [Sporothrix brasiliensis 5110]KIH87588.1 hypothetical protein SPBR_05438 [Sporothrix brasiliensis 5110]
MESWNDPSLWNWRGAAGSRSASDALRCTVLGRRSAGLTRNTADVPASATTPSTKASAERLVNIAEAVDEARRVEEVSVFQDLLAIE